MSAYVRVSPYDCHYRTDHYAYDLRAVHQHSSISVLSCIDQIETHGPYGHILVRGDPRDFIYHRKLGPEVDAQMHTSRLTVYLNRDLLEIKTKNSPYSDNADRSLIHIRFGQHVPLNKPIVQIVSKTREIIRLNMYRSSIRINRAKLESPDQQQLGPLLSLRPRGCFRVKCNTQEIST